MQYRIVQDMSAEKLGAALGLSVVGDLSQNIKEVGSLATATSNVLTFSKLRQHDFIKGVVIGPEGTAAESLIVSSNPRLDFCRALQFLIESKVLLKETFDTRIHETSRISNSAVIEEGVTIGENALIEHNVTIHQGTVIGANTIVRANSVVGAQGFGFERDTGGNYIRFPHLGRVVLGDNVEIGALNSICVGALDDTIVHDGVKTDNLVHIAHNCQVGRNSILTASVELSGGVVLGEGVWMGPNSSTMQKISIGDFAVVGLGSVVTKNVSPGHTVAGVPARILKRA